jgi:monovalent cation:proton antiporter-2 (CPA2) family protein
MNEFINQALVFVGATVLVVPLFHLLGLGSVLGYLLAGIIVGPHVLGLIHEAESVLHFAELGVVLLLFIIGLEIQPRKLWGMRRHLLGLGGSQVLLCSLLFMAAGLAYGLSPLAAGITGFALSLSSTAFALQYLIAKNQFNTTFGQASFAILLSQDLLAIPALALIPALAVRETAGQAGPTLQTLGLFLALITLLGLVSHFLIRPLFRLIASTRTRELFTATTLLIVFGVAALMMSIGLSAALGTFIAGVLLAESEYRHELEANLDPFKSLLMGLFFIAVGMGLSLPLIFAHPLLILGLTSAYMALKMGTIYGVGRGFKLSHDNAKLMALAVGQGGEFAFVIFGMVQSFGIAPSEPLAILTAVITVSMALSPLLNLAHERLMLRCDVVPSPDYDVITNENPEIIIAGFGRFGQIFGRILKSQGIPFVAIDHDVAQVDSLRKFGHKVYYGDASRRDILETAGVARAKYFVLAIDDMEQSLATAKTLGEHFPHIKIFARARNRGHVFEFMELGLTHIKRETFDASLDFVGALLREMGHPADRAKAIVERFRTHDEMMILEQYKVRTDENMFVSVATQGQAQFNQVMAQDSQQSYIKPIQ